MGAVVAGGCSRKLSSGGGPMDALAYDILKMDRGTGWYFETLRSAHDRTNFAYRSTDDPFLADKCVDAIRHLGDAKYDRLEGEVQVILLLSDVLLEDPIVLAKIQAAEALTKLAIGLPTAPAADRPERGDRYLALLKELDAMHDEEGRRRNDTPAARTRVIAIFDEIGSFRFPKLLDTKNGLRFFPARAYVTRETDPTVREAIDRAMVRRARAVIVVSLTDAVQESSSAVREAALRGLRTLAVPDAVDAVIERIPVESGGLVRAAIADYLGAVGGGPALRALVGLLDDDDATVRHHAHEALIRVGGRDLGREPLAWAGYANSGALPPSSPSPTVLPTGRPPLAAAPPEPAGPAPSPLATIPAAPSSPPSEVPAASIVPPARDLRPAFDPSAVPAPAAPRVAMPTSVLPPPIHRVVGGN